jgi:Spy/CpxP family protein refolding chaperone
MRRWLIHAVVFVLGAGVAAFAWPQEKPAKKHGLAAVYDELGLTPAVAAELKALDEKVGPHCKELGEKRRALYAELARDTVDSGEVGRISAELTALRTRMQADVVEHLLAVKAVLTPEQRKRLFERLTTEKIR